MTNNAKTAVVPVEPMIALARGLAEDLENGHWSMSDAVQMIRALSDRLAPSPQPASRGEGEAVPVAWRWRQLMHDSMGGWEMKIESYRPGEWARPEDIEDLQPLYASPPPAVSAEDVARVIAPLVTSVATEFTAAERDSFTLKYAKDILALFRPLDDREGEG